ncbi:zinc finger MYM-type protein 4 isoform X2 [Clupea harengus]|nr:zinc finger MYM-type protein 4 isoform X2 [Clupea harengus]
MEPSGPVVPVVPELALYPSLPLLSIKDEPMDEGYDVALQQPQPSASRIKQELDQPEEFASSSSTEQLRISAVFSVSGSSNNSAAPAPMPQASMLAPPRTAPALAPAPTPALAPPPVPPLSAIMIRCSGCSKVLQRGQTAFQRKGFNQLFCSTPCLTGAALPPVTVAPPMTTAPPPVMPIMPIPPAIPPTRKKFCSNCHKEVVNLKDLIKAPVGNTMRDFCSQTCMESLSQKMALFPRPRRSADGDGDVTKCSICQKMSVIEHEVNHFGSMHKLCSDHCFTRFRVINNVSVNVCESCGNHCSSSTGTLCLLQADEWLKKFCSTGCIFTYRQKCKQAFSCSRCHITCYAQSMLESPNQLGITELFCSNKCRITSRVPNNLADAQFPCTQCQNVRVPQYHLATGDGAIRNFCSVKCVNVYQEKSSTSTPLSQMNGSTSVPTNPMKGQPYPQQPPTPPPHRVPHLTQMLNPLLHPLPPYVPTPLHNHGPQHLVPGSTHLAPPHYIPAPAVAQPGVLYQQQQQHPNQHQQQQQQQRLHHPQPSSSISTYQLPRIYCKQCSQGFNAKPQVLQHKDQVWLFCGKTCCELFKRLSEIMALCDYCKLNKVLKDVSLTFENNPRTFCSEGCKLLFKHDLSKRLGQQCSTCAFCSNMSPQTIPNYFGGKVEEFCSKDCMSAYTVLFYEMAKCDVCKKQGRLTESLKWKDGVKHFCNQLCFINFCLRASQQNQRLTNGTGNAAGLRPAGLVSAPAQPSVSKETPVIGDVVSLASTPSGQPGDSAHTALTGALPTSNSHAKIIGDASTQTDAMKLPSPPPRMLKNKALMCKPIMVERGVQCRLESPPPPAASDEGKHAADKETGSREDAYTLWNMTHKVKDEGDKEEKVRLVPVPVPVPVPIFIPVPMCMYTQYMPVPMGMAIPVPVPFMVPSKPDGTGQEAAEGGTTPRTPADVAEEEEEEEEEEKMKDKAASVGDQGSTYSGDLESEAMSTPVSLEDDPASHFSIGAPTPNPEGPQDSTLSQAPPGGDDTHTPGEPSAPVEQKVALKHRGLKRPREGAPLRKRSRKRGGSPLGGSAAPSGGSRLNPTYGVQAWLSWVQWRNKQLNCASNVGKPSGARAMVVKEDVLQCSSAELSYGLCRFISEVRRPDGQPYAADSTYCLCLGIQQYLFENGRIENIFTDSLYNKFTVDITKMLKNWGHTVEPHELLQSRVEEEYLWHCKQLGAYSPIVLLSTLLFFATKLFRFTTLAHHRRLAFSHISRLTHTSPGGKIAYVRFRIPGLEKGTAMLALPSKQKLEENDDSQEGDLEMPENKDNPLRCPVRLYEFYLSKCSESVRKRTDLFYLQPERVCDPNSPLWYSDQPLENATLENLLTRIQAVRQVYTGDTEEQNQATSTDESS